MTAEQEALQLKILQDVQDSLRRMNSNLENLFWLSYSVNAPTAIGTGSWLYTSEPARRLVPNPLPCIWLILQANESNGGVIAYGDENVHADTTIANLHRGHWLKAGERSPVLPINDVSKVWVDGYAEGDGLTFIYLYKPFEDKNKILSGLVP